MQTFPDLQLFRVLQYTITGNKYKFAQVVDGARQLLLLSGGLLAFYQSSTLSRTVQPRDLCDARLHSC